MKWLCATFAVACTAVEQMHTHLDAKDLCDDSCRMVDRKFNFPEYALGIMPQANFSIQGRLLEDVARDWHYSVTAQAGPDSKFNPVMAWNGTGTACGYTKVGDNVAFILEINLPDCDLKAGLVEVAGRFRVSFPAPPIIAIIWILPSGMARVKKSSIPMCNLCTRRQKRSHWGQGLHHQQSHLSSSQALGVSYPRANISSESCCDDSCLLKDMVLDFPQHFPPHSDQFHFTVSGNFLEEIRSAKFTLHAQIHAVGILPLTVLVGNGTGCGVMTTGDHAEFKMELDFPHCPAPVGHFVLLAVRGSCCHCLTSAG